MKLLIFSSLSPKSNGVGCGWITGLIDRLSKNEYFEILYCYLDNQKFDDIIGNVRYRSITKSQEIIDKIKRYLNPITVESKIIIQMQQLIEEYKPDVVHVFGSETVFGLISEVTNVPVIIHLQGLMIPYVNAWYPNGFSEADLKRWQEKRGLRINKYYAERERRIFSSCKLYMGRTDWDERVSKLYSPDSKYFRCEEMLRPEFYQQKPIVKQHCSSKVKIVSVLSSPLYKGHDVILKTAHILKTIAKINFEWTVLGYNSMDKAENKFGLRAADNNIKLAGRKNVTELIEILKESDIFIHPSYIDNSPNSVCEAQWMGLPVIACNAGGVSSLMDHRVSGILVPCNDPYMIVSYIKELINCPSFYESISSNAISIASKRHNQEKIISRLMSIYNEIV